MADDVKPATGESRHFHRAGQWTPGLCKFCGRVREDAIHYDQAEILVRLDAAEARADNERAWAEKRDADLAALLQRSQDAEAERNRLRDRVGQLELVLCQMRAGAYLNTLGPCDCDSCRKAGKLLHAGRPLPGPPPA